MGNENAGEAKKMDVRETTDGNVSDGANLGPALEVRSWEHLFGASAYRDLNRLGDIGVESGECG